MDKWIELVKSLSRESEPFVIAFQCETENLVMFGNSQSHWHEKDNANGVMVVNAENQNTNPTRVYHPSQIPNHGPVPSWHRYPGSQSSSPTHCITHLSPRHPTPGIKFRDENDASRSDFPLGFKSTLNFEFVFRQNSLEVEVVFRQKRIERTDQKRVGFKVSEAGSGSGAAQVVHMPSVRDSVMFIWWFGKFVQILKNYPPCTYCLTTWVERSFRFSIVSRVESNTARTPTKN